MLHVITEGKNSTNGDTGYVTNKCTYHNNTKNERNILPTILHVLNDTF